jgi:hypothetical protein
MAKRRVVPLRETDADLYYPENLPLAERESLAGEKCELVGEGRSPMLDSPNSELYCSICANPTRLFAPDICRDESDRIVHIECYLRRLAQSESSGG